MCFVELHVPLPRSSAPGCIPNYRRSFRPGRLRFLQVPKDLEGCGRMFERYGACRFRVRGTGRGVLGVIIPEGLFVCGLDGDG